MRPSPVRGPPMVRIADPSVEAAEPALPEIPQIPLKFAGFRADFVSTFAKPWPAPWGEGCGQFGEGGAPVIGAARQALAARGFR